MALRRSFSVADEVAEATLWVSCDNHARVLMNGREAVRNDDWSAPAREDVKDFLRTGKNELIAEAHNDEGVAGLLLRLRLRLVTGAEVVVESDSTWEGQVAASEGWRAVRAAGRYGEDPWGDVMGLGLGRPLVVQPADIQCLPGFRVELLHVVAKADEGSWVSMTVDPEGRVLACDQYGGLFRLTPSPVGSNEPGRVERVRSPVGGAHGLLYAFDSLYVMVNEEGGKQGLWRLRDLDGSGHFEDGRQLRAMAGGGEHGPHAVVLGPDRASLYVVCGNHTKLPEGLEQSRDPMNWAEDQLLPRLWDANGHARGVLAPGGYICRTDPEGRVFELVSHGYRNAYDFAFNDLGDLITYDSDMEWDAGLPWYRPTRICLATSGSEFGWRSGSGKWPSYYPDSLPALVDIGPGSPTGMESGRGARFPAKYQRAIYANDWTYGTMYAIHLTPAGGAYRAVREEFLSAKPLPLTDVVINPRDGALYFAIGGRRTQSAVYRVSYAGADVTAKAEAAPPTAEMRLRWRLETLHSAGTGPEAIEAAWPYLGHDDRWVRYAARVAAERQPVRLWISKVLGETRPWATVEAAVALAHAGSQEHRDDLLERLHALDWAKLNSELRLALVRAYALVMIRLGRPEGEARDRLVARLDAHFPAIDRDLDRELAAVLIVLGCPTAVPKTMQLLATARDAGVRFAGEILLERNEGYAEAFNKATLSRPNQQQIAYAHALRVAEDGWNSALRRAFFGWFPSTMRWEGGNSFRGFLDIIRREALDKVSDVDERQALDALSLRQENVTLQNYAPPQGPGQDYSVATVMGLIGGGLRDRDFALGQSLYHSAGCFACHRFGGSGGGLGPDLTTSASRFSLADLVENIVEPSKVISDQYGSEQLELDDGSTLIGRAYEENGRLHVLYDPRNPDEGEDVDLARIRSRRPYGASFMPGGLLNALNAEEVLDLLAYIQSGGDSASSMFNPAQEAPAPYRLFPFPSWSTAGYAKDSVAPKCQFTGTTAQPCRYSLRTPGCGETLSVDHGRQTPDSGP